MFSMRSMLSATITAGALLATTATAAHADGRPLFVWSGTVDREAIIVMRGASLETQGDGFESYREARYRVSDALPRAAGSVRVQRADGRGEVDVIEQPSPFNGFTTRVRVRDRQSGSDRYRLIATWEGAGDDRFDDRDKRGRGRGNGKGKGNGRFEDYDDRDRGRGSGNGRFEDYDDRDRGRGSGNGRFEDYDDLDRGRGNGEGNGRFEDRDDRGRGEFGTHRDAGVLRFSAVVDDVAEIRIRGRRVDVVSRSGRPLYNVRYAVRGSGLPNYALPLDLRRLAGRGNVRIAQYPGTFNNWTAIIRIDDSRGGADNYDIDLRW